LSFYCTQIIFSKNHNCKSKYFVLILQTLTGGTLLSRDKEAIVFYRGKDFLPPAVSLAIENRRKQDSFIKDKMDHNIEESKPHEDTSELKISSDVSAHMHEEKTSIIENTAESLSMIAQNVETRLSQVCLQLSSLVIECAP
jgi:hypothetical protein